MKVAIGRAHVGPFSSFGPRSSRLLRWEPWLAVPCALALLLYPNPLVGPAALLGVLLLGARWLVTGRPWRHTAFDLPLILLVLGALLGAIGGLNREGANLRLSGLFGGLLLYAVVLEHTATPRRLRAVTLLLLGVAVVGSFALLVIVAPYLRLDRVPPLGALPGLLDPAGVTQRVGDEDVPLQWYRLRASGVGALADVGLALIFGLVIGLWGRIRNERRTLVRALALVPLALFFAAMLLAADNRGSIIAAAVTLGAMAGYWRPRLLPLIPVAGLATVALIAAGLIQRGLNRRTIDQRLFFWENGTYLAQEVPFTGAGLGTRSVQLTYETYFQPSYPRFSHSHNIYVQGLLEQGIFGLLGLAGLVLATLWVGWQARRATDPWTRAAGLAGFGTALAMFSTGLSEITALSTLGGALTFVSLALVGAAARQAIPADRSNVSRAVPGEPSPQPTPRGSGSFGSRSPWERAKDVGSPTSASRVRATVIPRLSRFPVGARTLIGVVLVASLLLLATGAASRGASLALLNVGTVDLNRATISEETSRSERPRLLEHAVWLLRTAEGLDRQNPAIPRNLAIALAAQDDNRRARAAVDRARAITPPSDRRGQFQLGRAYIEVSAWSEAIRAWEAADAGPQLVQLASQIMRARNWDQAIRAYTASAIANPRSGGAYEGIVRAARARGDNPEEIVAAFEPLIARGDLNEYFARLEIARAYREDGRPSDALESLRLAERVGSDHELVLERGIAYTQLGRYDEALPLLRAVRAAVPDEVEPVYWLGVAWAGQGNHEGAVAAARAGLARLEPRQTAERGRFMALIGDSLLQLGRPSEALEAYEQGLVLLPDDRHLADGAARARAQAGA